GGAAGIGKVSETTIDADPTSFRHVDLIGRFIDRDALGFAPSDPEFIKGIASEVDSGDDATGAEVENSGSAIDDDCMKPKGLLGNDAGGARVTAGGSVFPYTGVFRVCRLDPDVQVVSGIEGQGAWASLVDRELPQFVAGRVVLEKRLQRA